MNPLFLERNTMTERSMRERAEKVISILDDLEAERGAATSHFNLILALLISNGSLQMESGARKFVQEKRKEYKLTYGDGSGGVELCSFNDKVQKIIGNYIDQPPKGQSLLEVLENARKEKRI